MASCYQPPTNNILQNAVLWGWVEQVPKFPELPSVKNDVYEALLFLCLCASTGNEATSKHILGMCLQWCYAVIIEVWLSNLERKNSYVMGFAESIYTTVAISFDGYSTDLLKGKRPTCYSQCTCTCPLASPYTCTPVCSSRVLERFVLDCKLHYYILWLCNQNYSCMQYSV